MSDFRCAGVGWGLEVPSGMKPCGVLDARSLTRKFEKLRSGCRARHVRILVEISAVELEKRFTDMISSIRRFRRR
jgi:hypothetical protein